MIATASMIDKFRQVYADVVEPTLPYAEAYNRRSIYWHGERVSLDDAFAAFALLKEGYNDFDSEVLMELIAAFPDAGIEVTPAREGSVAVYLHIPNKFKARVKAFVLVHFLADEVGIVTNFSCLQDGETELVGEALRVWWD